MKSTVRKMPRRGFFIACAALLVVPFLMMTRADAAAPGSLYSYALTGSTPFQNQAAANTSVALTPTGDWSPTAFGVRFDGNTTNKRSTAYAKPTSGNTISVAASKAVGAGILFKYEAPTNGTCFSDSHNMLQIGKFGAGLGQIKLQLSNCGKNRSNVFVQCRMAGSKSTTNDLPVTGTMPLVNGERYIATCVKAPDPVSGKATTTLKTVRIDELNGNQTTTNSFQINPTGTIQSSSYLSVANKYPLPSYSNNTDQFVGEVANVAFCDGVTTQAANDCLAIEVPEP